MFKVSYVRPEDATGTTAEIYGIFPPEVGVPAPLQLFSASEPYLAKQMAVIKHIVTNDRFEQGLLAALRYVGASVSCFDHCSAYNAHILKGMGLSDRELAALDSAPEQAFEPHEAALIRFAAKAVRTPDEVTDEDVATALAAGWTDQELFEATAYAAQMATVGIVFRAFSK